MIRRFCLAALLLVGREAVAQNSAVTVRDAGPGPVGRYLTELLARADTRVIIGDTVTITKDSTYPGSVVVIGKRANLTGTIHGDLVVVGGDLFLKPNGRIEGEGIAIGGGAYNSLLGSTRDGLTSYRDFTFEAERTSAGVELRYREEYVQSSEGGIFALPALYGLRIPSYDRSNGVSLSVGPAINIGQGTVDVLGTYRSQLGRVDPSIEATLPIGRKLRFDAWAGRDTKSNDDWINSDFLNSVNVLLAGRDERNWYRATGGWGTVSKIFETSTMTATYSLGGAFERGSAVRPGLFPTSGPWSIINRKDPEWMFRPNPQIAGGDITSVIGGAVYRWRAGEIRARLDVDLEVPVSVSNGGNFLQTTIDGRVEFPTFGLQKYRLDVHGLVTVADTAPAQRFAYIGGPGTLPTEDLFLTGGDELLFIESRYEIPMPRLTLPFVGAPTLVFRHILGAAGVQTLPDITQIVGARLSISFARAQVLMNTATKEVKFNAGLSLTR